MHFRKTFLIFIFCLEPIFLSATDFSKAVDLGHFLVRAREHHSEPFKSVKSAKGNFFVVQPYKAPSEWGKTVYSIRNISPRLITNTGSVEAATVDALLSYGSSTYKENNSDILKGQVIVNGQSRIENNLNPNDVVLYTLGFSSSNGSKIVDSSLGPRIDVSLQIFTFDDGSQLNFWTLMSSRNQAAQDIVVFNRQIDALIRRLNNGESISLLSMVENLTKEVDPQFILNKKKQWYTTGVFLKKFPKTSALFDVTVFDSLVRDYSATGRQKPSTPSGHSWNFLYFESTVKAQFVLVKRKNFETFAQTFIGQSALSEIPTKVITPQPVASFVKSAPELDPSFVAGSRVGLSFTVQNSFEYLVATTGSQSGLWDWPAVYNVPAVSGALNFSGNYTDLNIKMEDPVSSANQYKMEGWGDGGKYWARNSSAFVPDMQVVFSVKNLENIPVHLKEIIPTGKNLSVDSYIPVEGPIAPQGTVKFSVGFNPLTWIYKDNGLKIVFLTKYYSTVTLVFETDVAPKRKFFRTVKIFIDYSKAPLVLAGLRNDPQAIGQFRQYFIPSMCIISSYCQELFNAVNFDGVERTEDVLALDQFSNSRESRLPLVGSYGNKAKVNYSFYGQRGGLLLTTSARSSLMVPSEMGKVVILPPQNAGAPPISRASEADPITFYTGLNVGGISVSPQAGSVSLDLLKSINEPIGVLRDQQTINFGKIGKGEERFKFITIKSQTFSPLEITESKILSSSAFLVVTAAKDSLLPFLNTYSLLRFKPNFSGSYYSAFKLKFAVDRPEGYTFWLAGEADLTKTSNPTLSPSPTATATTPVVSAIPQVFIASTLVNTTQNFETDLGAVKVRQDPMWVDVLIRNLSGASFDLTKVVVDAGFKMEPTVFSTRAVAAGAVVMLRISVDPAKAGAQSGYLRMTYRVGAVSRDLNFRIGGVSWSASLATTEAPLVGLRPSPSPIINPNFREFGSEHLALIRAKTAAAFFNIAPRLTLDDAEKILNVEIGAKLDLKSLWDLIRASKRAAISEGAKLVVTDSTNAIASQNATAYLRKISDLMRLMQNDPFCKARSDLIRAVSTVPQFKDAVRVYSQLALKSLSAERFPNSNSLGRYYMRLAFLRAYLSTNPPLEEAWAAVEPTLLQLRDEVSRAPLLNAFLVQFPEAALAVSEAASAP